jgi:hypothetical protein
MLDRKLAVFVAICLLWGVQLVLCIGYFLLAWLLLGWF